MMDRNMSTGCSGCLNIIGTPIGIVAGTLTILTYFDTPSDSLIHSLTKLMVAWLPVGTTFLDQLLQIVKRFSDGLGPWFSAGIVFLVIAVLRYLAEVTLDLWTTEVTLGAILAQGIFFLPLAFLWVSIFSGPVIGGAGMLIFLMGYIATIWLSIVLASRWGS